MVAPGTRPSLAVFCPQTRAPQEDYLSELRTFICSNRYLRRLTGDVQSLSQTWEVLASNRPDIAALTQGPKHVQALSDWITHGHSKPVANGVSGILCMPLLTILEIAQYFQFLEAWGMSHADVLASVQKGSGGGIQGYCAGLLPAIAVATAKNEDEIIFNTAAAIRIGLAIGACTELGDDMSIEGTTTVVMRLKYVGQGEEIVEKFPGTYIGAITDPKTIGIVGPADILNDVAKHVQTLGLIAQPIHLRGKNHNPENAELATELCRLCDLYPSLQLPNTEKLQVRMHSNRTARPLEKCNLTHEAIRSMLSSSCDWYKLLQDIARELQASDRPTETHLFTLFGIGDPVPLGPFYETRIRVKKMEILETIRFPPPLEKPYGEDAIAIIGAACRLPGANDLEELWDLISQGMSRCEPVRRERVPLHDAFRLTQSSDLKKRTFYGNFIDDVESFEHGFFRMNPKEAASMDPQQRILLELAYQAMDSSGYLRHHERDHFDNVGCFIGASSTEYHENTSAHGPTAYTATGTLRAFLCGKISYYFGWSGPAENVDTACSSSLIAIHRACRAILTGECPLALAGGVNVLTGVNHYLDLVKAGFISPTGQCKPFDEAADGYCRADGAGLVVLKRLSAAIADGDSILGVVPGIATNQGGISSSLTVPHSPSQIGLYQKILAQSGMTPDHVTYVEAHGPGTQAGDPIEISGIRQALGGSDRVLPLHVGSIKGNIGHTEAAAGVASLLKVLVMLNKGKITPLASHKNVNPKLGIADSDRIILDKALENWNAPLRVACVNSYGAAGSNAALLCCEPPSPNPATTTSKSSIVPILISAASKESALSYSKSLAKYLDREHVGMLDLAYTLAERRQHHRFRWSTAASSIADVQYSLGNLSESSFNELPKETGNIVLAFSGQSKHTVGLEKSLYDANPLFRHYIESCNTELVNTGFKSIVPAIFDQNSLDDIVVLQTGTFAVQYACARCWIDAGLKIRAVIGHSFGELTALAVSGAVSLEDGLRIVARRASLMATKWGPERGVMLAVHSNRETVDNLISCVGENEIEIACHNAETSSVLVGSVKSVSKAELLLASDPRFGGIRYQKLDVSHGFHSRFTEPLLPELLSVADSISFQDPNIHLETCTSEANNGVLEPSYLVKHTRSPVHFVDAVHRIEDRLGSCVWLEAGFDSPIIPMIRRATKSKDHSFQPASSGDVTGASNTLGSAVAKLWVNGITASFWPFLSSRETGVKQIWLPPYIFNRSRAWLENVDRATEIQKAVQAGTVAAAPPPPPTHLVTQTRKDAKSAHFEVHIATKRFSSIVSGHAVRRRPLCPASMYMECATMAGQTLAGIQSTTKKYLYFDDLQFESPLGVDLSKKLSLALEDVANSSAWKFVLSSVAPDQPKPTIHARGKLRFGEPAGLEKHQALVFSQMTMLAAKPDTETLMSTRAYGLFSQVVTYADLLKGISSITMDGNHASAVIKLPRDHVGEKETTACNVCDTVSLDAFVQVVGLLINSSDNSTVNDCFVATGIKTTVMTGSCDFLKNKSWTVYARYSMINANKAEGEVFVLKPDYSIAIVFQGISFSKVATSTLEDMLDGVNSQSSSDTSAKVNGRSNALKPDTNGAVSSHQRAVYLPEPSPETAHDAIGGSGMNYLNEDLNGASADALNGVSNTSTAAASTPTNSTGSAEPQFAAGGRAAIANDIIKDISGADISMADNDQTLGDLGFDSLAIVQLKNDLEDAFSMELDDVHLGLEIGQLLQLVGADAPTSAKSIASTLEDSQAPNSAEPGKDVVAEPKIAEFTDSPAYIHDLTESLAQSSISLPDMAARRGYHAYWRTVAPRQGDIIVACILEAFRELGIDVRGLKAGEHVAHINSLPRYKRVLERFFHILQKYAVIERREGQWVRTPKRLRETPSEVLVEKFVRDFPHYAGEARLIAITGPKLDACLTGKTDPIALLFSSRESQDALENYYFNSPMLATATDLLVDVVRRSVAASKGDLVRIIEIGAGFGGTTKRLIDAIRGLGPRIQYTYTDIATTLVSRASKLFDVQSNVEMEFKVLNIEKDPPVSLKGRYDLVISTNCVHATSNKTESILNIKSLLNSHGFIILSEVTDIIDWYDVVWGLLDSWWLSHDKSYAIEPPESWMQRFRRAGLSATYSEGSSRDLNSQRLLIASPRPLSVAPKRSLLSQPRLSTVVYKQVEGVEIHADIFLPEQPMNAPMAIALMIHGGGHMTLSRKAIRPAQSAFLLANGVLPVSLDFRLCPEVSFIDGAMVDIRDAYAWAQEELPHLMRPNKIDLDTSRIAVIGWSTGGHLAMTTGWTLQDVGLNCPKVILSFYSPTDFESGDLDGHRKDEYPQSLMTMSQIIEKLPKQVVTGHEAEKNMMDGSGLAWIKPGDPRSELVLSLLKEGNGLPLLLNGISNPEDYKRLPNPKLVKAISPMAQVQDGRYKTPTYIVHGTLDEVVPYDSAVNFVQALRDHGVDCGFLTVEGVKHIHDLDLKPGTVSWEAQVAPAYEFLLKRLLD